MKIGIITNEAFPNGMATTNRIISLAKALIRENIQVKVYCVRATENRTNQNNTLRYGYHDEIEFQYTNNNLLWPANKIKKVIIKSFGILFWIPTVLKDNKDVKFDVLISTTTPLISNTIFYFVTKLLKVKLIVTSDEFPIFIRNSSKKGKLYHWIYLKVYPKLFNGFIVMTKTLIKFWKNYTLKKTKFIHIPMTVDIDRFNKTLEIPDIIKNKSCITYVGNLGHNEKDGLPILISAFSKIIEKGYNYYLIIIGHAKQSEQKQVDDLKKLVHDLGIQDRVIFTGKVNKDYIPNYMVHSELLALARPNNKQAQGGFPTKLGEYLASKRPVIVTKVGEIPDYLNEKSAYLSKPDSIDSFSDTIEKAIVDSRKEEIGMNGYKIAETFFNYKQYSNSLKSFFTTLITNG